MEMQEPLRDQMIPFYECLAITQERSTDASARLLFSAPDHATPKRGAHRRAMADPAADTGSACVSAIRPGRRQRHPVVLRRNRQWSAGADAAWWAGEFGLFRPPGARAGRQP